MPVEFLSDREVAAYGRYAEAPSPAELDRWFLLDDADKALIRRRRGDHHRLGFALQLTTARFVGAFLPDPLDVPAEVVIYLAKQLDIDTVERLGRYSERRSTRFEHQDEIRAALGLTEFPAQVESFTAWLDGLAYTTGDGPHALFAASVDYLRAHRVLLPGVSTLARLVARVRSEAADRLHRALCEDLTGAECARLDELLVVGDGARVCELERWRKGVSVPSGKNLEKALKRAGEITGSRLPTLVRDAGVPRRRLLELARAGMAAKASALRRQPAIKRWATVAATVAYLEGKAIDDALELLDLLVVTELLGKAERASDKQTLRVHPRLARASMKLARAVSVLFEVTDHGGGEVSLDELWEAIEVLTPRPELHAAMRTVEDLVPDSEATDPDTHTRALLASRIATVSGFVKVLTQHIAFGADPEAGVVLEAMRGLPRLLDGRHKIVREDLAEELLTGSWRRLVLPGERRIDKNSYVFCVLTAFHRHLKRREIYAPASTRWCDPKAQLLDGRAYQLVGDEALGALGLPTDPATLLEQHALSLHLALSEVAGRAAAGDGEFDVDADGRLHLRRLSALPDPPSLVDLAARTKAMLPKVDLPELILEVMDWVPGFETAFTATGGNPTRLEDLGLSIAACLAVSAMNLDHTAVIKKGVPALERGRLSHVAQNYLGVEAYARANAPLIAAQAEIGFARTLGGGLLAAVDGMRFVVPVPSVYARPNRKYFGSKRGVTWLNVINDRGIGLAGKVLSGTPRDSLHMIDVVYSQDGGQRPDVIVSDAGAYSDLVFGLVHLLDMEYRPALADLPDHKGWRIKPEGGYGPLDTFARGLIDLNKIRARWEEILRVVVSIHTGAIRAYDVVTMLQREGRLSPLGEAIASYGRIFKTLHILAAATEEPYRRDIKGLRNLQEERHGLAEKIFHGKKGELYQRYHRGMETQLSGLGLILNCVTLWNTRYLDAALHQLRAQGYPILDEDVARLSPFAHGHLNVTGTYSFVLPDLAGGLRPLRDDDQE